MPYQLFDKLRSEEFDALEADILKRGIQIPIERDRDGNILDGHHRLEIAEKHGLKYEEIIRDFKTEQEKTEHIIMLNLARRHLEPWQWGRAFKKLLEVKGIKTGRGKGNPHAKESKTETVSVLATSLGVDDRTARNRMRAATEFETLPKADQKAVIEKKKTISQAKREKKKAEKKKEFAAKAKVAAKANASNDWQIIHGDCYEQLAKLHDESARLIFADPPYNIGIDYGNGPKADQMPDTQYMLWVSEWLAECERIISGDGSLWVMIGDEYAAEYAIELKKLGFTIRSWIKWYETFGVNCPNNFNRCSRHIFYCVKNKKDFVFNTDAVNRPSDRQQKYHDKRAEPDGKIWDDVWIVPRLVGTAKERIPDFPTQIPLEITRAIVGCASEPGDLVVDPFAGSASIGVAAIEFGRRFIGIEKGKQFCELARIRLAGITPASIAP